MDGRQQRATIVQALVSDLEGESGEQQDTGDDDVANKTKLNFRVEVRDVNPVNGLAMVHPACR